MQQSKQATEVTLINTNERRREVSNLAGNVEILQDRMWVKVRKPRRGRPRLEQPCKRDQDILRLLKVGYTLTALSERFSISKQRISQIRDRWSFGRYKGYTPKTFKYRR